MHMDCEYVVCAEGELAILHAVLIKVVSKLCGKKGSMFLCFSLLLQQQVFIIVDPFEC